MAGVLGLVVWGASSAWGAAPLVLTHQGRLTDPSGNPVVGPADLRVTLYDTVSATNGFWTKLYDDVPVQDGYFAVSLVNSDSNAPLDPANFADGNTWVGVAVGGVDVGPRQQLGSVPYALVAGNSGITHSTSTTCATGGELYWNPTTESLGVCAGGTVRVLATYGTTPVGTGADGSATVTGLRDLNATSLGASGDRNGAAADGVAYRVSGIAGTTVTLNTTPSGLVAGDLTVLVNLQGVAGDTASVGNHQFFRVASISGPNVTLVGTPNLDYDGTGNSFTNQKVVLQRIPEYTNLTVASGGTVTAGAFNGLATPSSAGVGENTGIVAMLVSGNLVVQAGGVIHADEKGFPGGSSSGPAWAAGGPVTTGGGGGGGGGGGHAGTSANGGAGGGGNSPGGTGATGCYNSSGTGLGAAGGGGAGTGGNGGLACADGNGAPSPAAGTGSGGHGQYLAGGGGGGAVALHGGANSSTATLSRLTLGGGASQGGGGGGGGAAHNSGGAGGGNAGGAGGLKANNGGGGGGGGAPQGAGTGTNQAANGHTPPTSGGVGAAGGAGGGIVLLWAGSADLSGEVRARGGNGGTGGNGGNGGTYSTGTHNGGGGGGGFGGNGASGGSVMVAAQTLTLGSNTIKAGGGAAGSGGPGGTASSNASGGASGGAGSAGAAGVIRLEWTTQSGVTPQAAADPDPASTDSYSGP
jgi:hypothetical protein